MAHPPVQEHDLVDDCLGCAVLARDPIGRADDAVLRRLAAAAVDRSAAGFDGSKAEPQLLAEKEILNLLERVGRLATVAPEQVERYLRDRWGIRCRIEGAAR